MPDHVSLDPSELFHLAVEAARRDDHGAAITYLKRAIDLPDGTVISVDDHARALYLLGAEYAQIGLVERAQDSMAQALALKPDMHTARFQYGLLLITCAQPQQALEALEPLAALGAEDPLFHFHQGLRHLVADEFPACRTSLLTGMSLNRGPAANAALNSDMQKLLDALPAPDAPATPDGDGSIEAGFAMSAYNRG
jgi:hypothetical protein